jgi:putative hydrolase of the HAD superfamily
VISVSAVVFDLDGTLFDHVASARAGLRSWLSGLGVEPTSELEAAWFEAEERHNAKWRTGEITWAEQRRRRLREFLPLVDVSPGSDHELDRAFTHGFLVAYEAAWVGYEDVDRALAALVERGFVLAMLTNGAEAQQRAKLARLGLSDRVGPVFTAERLGLAKPDPRAFLVVCEHLGLAPDAVLYVGDDYEIDVVAARAAGLNAVHLARPCDDRPSTEGAIPTLAQLLCVIDKPPATDGSSGFATLPPPPR